MRPVNLIPPESRRGSAAPARVGAASYLVLVGLGVALAVVVAIVLTGNQIADRKSQKASLTAELQQAQARASALGPYADFASLSDARRQTVVSLAQSRFDWERVLRELAIVMPDDVWLTDVTGTVSSGVNLEGGADLGARDQVAGPALSIVGCGASQEAVAKFAADLRDIDGVTRVGVQDSSLNGEEASSGSSGSGCQTRDFIAQFQMLAAFDAVPVAGAATATDSGTDATATTASTATTTGSGG